jgi:hypothetical protein
MTLEAITQLQSTAEGYQLHWTPPLTPLTRAQKLWRSILAGLNQDLAEQTLQFQILAMTHLIKHSLLHYTQVGFPAAYRYPIAGTSKTMIGA